MERKGFLRGSCLEAFVVSQLFNVSLELEREGESGREYWLDYIQGACVGLGFIFKEVYW